MGESNVNGIYCGQQCFLFCFHFICAKLHPQAHVSFLLFVSSTVLSELWSYSVWSLLVLQGRTGPWLSVLQAHSLWLKHPATVVLEAGPSSHTYVHYCFISFSFGLNMFLVPQVSIVSMNFGISPSSKLDTNLVLHLYKCVNLVLLTKFC